MSTQSYIFDDTYVADAAIGRYRAVINGTTAGHVTVPGGQDALPVGVTQHATSASGDTVLVRRAGITKVETAAAVTLGVPLRIFDIRGMVSGQAAAWVSGDGVVGYAEEAATASGDIIECWLGIRQLLA